MNAKTNLTALGLILFALSGCASSAPVVQVVPCDQEMSGGNFAPSSDDATLVNYTQTDGNYREFGERAPRDQYITQAGAGNNISASIPPRADDEYLDYEEELIDENPDGDASAGSESGYNVLPRGIFQVAGGSRDRGERVEDCGQDLPRGGRGRRMGYGSSRALHDKRRRQNARRISRRRHIRGYFVSNSGADLGRHGGLR